MKINIKRISQQEFGELKPAWSALLSESTANPLFLSWEWLYSWWETWGEQAHLELFLLLAHDEQDEQERLLGIAPLYRVQQKIKGVLNAKRLQFIGNYWRGSQDVMRTEFTDFIIHKDHHAAVFDALWRYINLHIDYSEFVIVDISKDSASYKRFCPQGDCQESQNCTLGENLLIREQEVDSGYAIDTSGQFADYLKQLSGNTRRQFYNKRNHMQKMGDVSIEYMQLAELEQFWNVFDRLRSSRWEGEFFNKDFKLHLQAVAERLEGEAVPRFSIMRVGPRAVSALCNYRVASVEYNINASFDNDFSDKLSPGLLHLSYNIEAAFADKVQAFDLLAGEGKNTNYKKKIAAMNSVLCTLQIVKRRRFKFVYRLYDVLRVIKHTILRR